MYTVANDGKSGGKKKDYPDEDFQLTMLKRYLFSLNFLHSRFITPLKNRKPFLIDKIFENEDSVSRNCEKEILPKFSPQEDKI